jgi:GNAT superfamily N-acetyltransferase
LTTPSTAHAPPRRAQARDVAAIEALQHAAYAPNRALLGVEPMPLLVDYHEIVAQMEVWLFGPEDALRGVLALEPERDALLIWSVASAPEAQGAGLGGLMLDFAQTRAREPKLATIRLYTGEKLPANIDWYERCGFAIDRIEALADRRIVHLSKPLARGGRRGKCHNV